MEESDKILFHYTSLEGLLGIIERRSIWATNVLYLNDASELNYSIGMLREQVVNFQRRIGNAINLKYLFLGTLLDNIDNYLPRYAFYVCSFSEERDLLSQWRGYCPNGIGFSLGFNFDELIECAVKHKFLIRPCTYDEKEQIDQVNMLIDKTVSHFKSEVKQYGIDEWNSLAIEFIEKFIRLAPTFKHPKFKEEKEWRIIAGFDTGDIPQLIKFRCGQSMIFPYIEIALPNEEGNLNINQVVVGPTHELMLSKASVEMLLKSKNVKFDEVLYSTIPYRNW